MIELSFSSELYSGGALTAAIEAYRDVAECELGREGDRYVVRVRPTCDIDAQLLADELGNFALGLTIERRGT